MKIVVVGGGAAGASAASRAKKLNPEAEVYLIEKSDMITHGPCGIPYYVEGIVKRKEDLITYTHDEFERERGIRVLIKSEVVEIDADRKILTVKKESGGSEKLSWDKLILATGAIPSIIPVPGTDLENVLTVRHPAEASELKLAIEKGKEIVIVGGGYIGIEMAEAITALGKKVTLLEMTKQLLPGSIDVEMSKIIEEEATKRGIKVVKGARVVELRGSKSVERVITENGEYNADTVILATGIKPNIALAKDIGVKIGKTGAVETNEYMETSVENVYAAGDLVEKFHRIKREKVWIPLAPSANKEGQVAGANAALGRKIAFPGIVGTSITKLFELYIGRTGLLAEEAEKYGFKPISKAVKVRTSAHYYPRGGQVFVKLIADEKSHRVLGAQIVGYDSAVAGYLDAVSIAVEREMTLEELYFSDLGYMPAVAPVWHPLVVAARVLLGGLL
ncbi:MAG: FAD-dependent oxidoreductase [Fervidicoccaceae archaeon]